LGSPDFGSGSYDSAAGSGVLIAAMSLYHITDPIRPRETHSVDAARHYIQLNRHPQRIAIVFNRIPIASGDNPVICPPATIAAVCEIDYISGSFRRQFKQFSIAHYVRSL
jgi:hypothetical protein